MVIIWCHRKKATEAAVALAQVFALPCDQRQVKCGRCKQMRWLRKALPKTAEAVEEEEEKKREMAIETRAARRKAEDDDVMQFLCRHAVGDEVTRPPCARQ